MPSLLQVPLKKSQSVDLIKPLSTYIKNNFSEEKLNDTKDSLAELNQLRANAVVKTLDKHESSLEVLQRYYDQLCSLASKLPIAEDQIRVNFTWQDAFDKGGIFGVTKASMISGAYEKLCTLFNIGSLLSQIACSQDFSSDDGQKLAAKYFQQASGIYAYLKDSVYPQLNTLPTPDLAVDCLAALSAIMVAQAQDAFYQKASSHNMKAAIVAKVAAQTADYYQSAYRYVSSSVVKNMWEKDWIPIIAGKQSFFQAAAEYHQSFVSKESGKYGEEVARLLRADKFINEAVKNGDKYLDSREMAERIKRTLTSSKKDNDFIYLDRVPNVETLEPVGRAALAKPTPVSSPMSSSYVDMFTGLVPMAVHQALAVYDSKKADLVNKEVGRLREATQVLNGVLASLNLPAAIEDLSGAKVPQSVLDKSAEVRKSGGLQVLDQMIQDLPELLTRNREIIDETFRIMNEEEREDTAMREHFKEKWTRTPSKKLTENLRVEGNKYKAILDNAVKADSIVKTKYNENRRALGTLCKSEADIAAALPQASGNAGNAEKGVVQDLRRLMVEVDDLKKQRDALEEHFKASSMDMAPKFLQALTAEGFIDTDTVCSKGLDEVYDTQLKDSENSVQKQEDLLSRIQTANDRFMAQSQSGAKPNEREQMLKEMAQAYDAFVELVANLKEGTKFYNDLTNILLKFQSKCNDLVFARKTEKEDLSKDIQNDLAKSSPASTPVVPAHIEAQRRIPPERPAPPSVTPSAAPSVAPSTAPPANAPYPYPTQAYMPQPGMYAPPGGIAGYSGNYMPPQPAYNPYSGGYYQPPQQQGYPGYQQPPPQQPNVGYTGYPYQRPPQQ